MPVRIFIADDDSAIRKLLRRLLEEQADWQVCGEAETGEDAVLKVAELKPDIAVLDLAMPRMNGLEAAREISKTLPHVSLLLLSVQEMSSQLMKEARDAGFLGAVSKGTGAEVVRGIEGLLRQQPYFMRESTQPVEGAADLHNAQGSAGPGHSTQPPTRGYLT
jgi:DNA-binding NarL/FixJ family response regulator